MSIRASRDIQNMSELAISGGSPVRAEPMPPRYSIGDGEREMLQQMFDYYYSRGLDPGYDGIFEEQYCETIVEYMGGGFADAVCSGTAAVYVAIKALELPQDCEVVISPITETGSVNPIILAGHKPVLADSKPHHYNVDAEQVFSCFTSKTAAVVLVHCAGQPVTEVEDIVKEAHARDIRVIEDCAQTTGGEVNGMKVGRFGDIAAWSTGSRKIQTAGANGGVVYSLDKDLMRKAVAYADRGKPKLDSTYEERNPNTYTLPALNLNADEIGCAMGIASVRRLEETRGKRKAFVKGLDERIENMSLSCQAYGWTPGDSPFFQPVIVDETKLSVDKTTFANAVAAEGIPLNPHYAFLCEEWEWLEPYRPAGNHTPNARRIRDSSFNVYLNENYGVQEAGDVIDAILKVEEHYRVA